MSELTEAMIEDYRHATEAYARAKADAEFEENQRKVTIALVMKTYADTYKSAAAQEREALASDNYRAQLDRCRESTVALEMARAWVKRAELRIELWRTEQANERTERRAYAA